MARISKKNVGGGRPRRRLKPLDLSHGMHWTVSKLYGILNETGMGVLDLSRRAGLGRSTISGWRHRVPSVEAIEACLCVVGYKLAVVDRNFNFNGPPVVNIPLLTEKDIIDAAKKEKKHSVSRANEHLF